MKQAKQPVSGLTQAGRILSKGVSWIFTPDSASHFQVANQSVYIPELPEAFESLRIVQLSDIHFYEYTCPDFKQRVIDAVNALDADIIVTTGDIIHYGQEYLEMSRHYLQQLSAPLGKWACMGNHDYSDDFQGMAVRRMMVEAGFEVLLNDAIPIEKGGKRFWLSGIDDFCKGRPDPEAAYAQVEADKIHISLAHNPRMAPLLDQEEKAPHIILSGHTHGGQIDHFIVNWMQRKVFHQPYQYGWFNFSHSKLYVTSGVGSAVVSFHIPPHFDFALYPFRVNTTPEIAVFNLTSQPLITAPGGALTQAVCH